MKKIEISIIALLAEKELPFKYIWDTEISFEDFYSFFIEETKEEISKDDLEEALTGLLIFGLIEMNDNYGLRKWMGIKKLTPEGKAYYLSNIKNKLN